jgi:hypothetical protein
MLRDAGELRDAEAEIKRMEEGLAAHQKEFKETKLPPEKDINAIALEVLDSLWQLAYCCRVAGKPHYVNEAGHRAVINRDGTVSGGSLIDRAPQAFRRFTRNIAGITVHTKVKGHSQRRRHDFLKGAIEFRLVGLDTMRVNPHVTV